MRFSDIRGQEELKKTLIGSIQKNHVAHAQLYAGQEGSAALALALAYATYLNCEDPSENDSCGTCPSCYKMDRHVHPDMHFVFPFTTTKDVPKDASCAAFLPNWRKFLLEKPYGRLNDWGNFIGAENKQIFINATESRSIIKALSLKSFEGKYKIMFIWLPELMKVEGANAILKILEEPPEKTIFLLVSNQTEKLITTILSRTQKVFVGPYNDEDIMAELIQHHQLDEEKAKHVAFLADGNLAHANEIIEDLDNTIHSFFREWMRLCYTLYSKASNLKEISSFADKFHSIGREAQKNFLQFGIHIIRETLLHKIAGEDHVRLHGEDLQFVTGFSKVLSIEAIEGITERLNKSIIYIERNANAKIEFIDASFAIATTFKKFK